MGIICLFMISLLFFNDCLMGRSSRPIMIFLRCSYDFLYMVFVICYVIFIWLSYHCLMIFLWFSYGLNLFLHFRHFLPTIMHISDYFDQRDNNQPTIIIILCILLWYYYAYYASSCDYVMPSIMILLC